MDLSNKSLALMLLAAIVISLGGTMISLNRLSSFQTDIGDLGITGRQTDTGSGTTTLTVDSAVGCNVDYNVAFGNGVANLNISTDSTNPSTFTDCSDGSGTRGVCTGMEINNTGNVDVNVSFNATDTAVVFLGGSTNASDFQYFARNGTYAVTEGGCYNFNASVWTAGSYKNVPTTHTILCDNMTFGASNDVITLEYNISLRNDVPTGAKTNTINVFCNEV